MVYPVWCSDAPQSEEGDDHEGGEALGEHHEQREAEADGGWQQREDQLGLECIAQL